MDGLDGLDSRHHHYQVVVTTILRTRQYDVAMSPGKVIMATL